MTQLRPTWDRMILGGQMYAVRRTLVVAGAAGLMLFGGPAYADNHDTSSSSATPTVDIAPPAPAPEADTVDCNFIAPAPGESVPGDAGPSDPATDPAPDGSAKPEPAPEAQPLPAPQDGQPTAEEFCIAASGPGIPEADTTAGGGAGGGGSGGLAPAGQLPRTGPAPLLPTIAVGSWLLLLGVVAMIVGRRPTQSLQHRS